MCNEKLERDQQDVKKREKIFCEEWKKLSGKKRNKRHIL